MPQRAPNEYSLFIKAVWLLRKNPTTPGLQINFVPKEPDKNSKANLLFFAPKLTGAQEFDAEGISLEQSYSIADMIQRTTDQGVTDIMSQANVIWTMVPDETKSIVKDAMLTNHNNNM